MNTLKKWGAGLAAGFGALMTSAHAAIDTVPIQAGLDAAHADALSVGEMVVVFVAGLIVIGVVINMVKKA